MEEGGREAPGGGPPSRRATPLAGGGSNVNPLTSYGYRTIGIIVEMTPRVTYDGDIILEITLENSAGPKLAYAFPILTGMVATIWLR